MFCEQRCGTSSPSLKRTGANCLVPSSHLPASASKILDGISIVSVAPSAECTYAHLATNAARFCSQPQTIMLVWCEEDWYSEVVFWINCTGDCMSEARVEVPVMGIEVSVHDVVWSGTSWSSRIVFLDQRAIY